MWRWAFLCAFLVSCGARPPQAYRAPIPLPNHFEIGKHTFVDFGPPFDFYELFIVRPLAAGSSIERIMLVPPGQVCVVPAKVDVASVSVDASPARLLESLNPCSISEEALERERERCENCLVFSGADVIMQVQCGDQTRLIRADILDRDMFDPAPNTPPNTSGTMRLLGRLGRAVGPGAMDQPIFPITEAAQAPSQIPPSPALQEVSEGKYDTLFQGAPHRPSDLYRAAKHPPPPIVRLVSVPSGPLTVDPPTYPPLARLARISGDVSVTFNVDASGVPTDLSFESGNPILQAAVRIALSKWTYPSTSDRGPLQAVFEFDLNCTEPPQ